MSKDAVVEILLELPIKILPSFRFGVAFVRPAPIILMLPLALSPLTTFAIFCTRFPSPVGAEVSYPPGVVADTYNSVPVAIPTVESCNILPKVSTSTLLPVTEFTIPNAGIFAESEASALSTVVLFPSYPVMYTTSPFARVVPESVALKCTAPSKSPLKRGASIFSVAVTSPVTAAPSAVVASVVFPL